MRKLNWYYKFLIIFLIFFLVFFLSVKKLSPKINETKIKNYVTYINIPINTLKEYNIFSYKSLKEENNKLKKENIINENIKKELEELKEENQNLKELLDLKSTYTDYKKIYGKVISRNKMYWYSTLTIDKGKKDNIKENDIVITKEGLIGTIKDITDEYSTIKLITNSDKENKISVAVKKDKLIHGTITEYNYPYLKVELLTKNSEIKEGDELVTSGLGNLPKNIEIGKIEIIKEDKYAMTNILYVMPYQDMDNIDYVLILSKWYT